MDRILTLNLMVFKLMVGYEGERNTRGGVKLCWFFFSFSPTEVTDQKQLYTASEVMFII